MTDVELVTDFRFTLKKLRDLKKLIEAKGYKFRAWNNPWSNINHNPTIEKTIQL